jgi:site-specific DNA-methyltransferase (adenine-specific)
MDIKNIPITDLKPATYNPRKISRQLLKTLKANIQEFGLVDPLVVNSDMTIIGGHQRFKACLELGFKEVPCVVLDLSKSKERALNLALNKVTGDWDRTKLEKLLHEIDSIDLGFTGFNDDELAQLVEDINATAPEYDIAPRLMEEYSYIVLFFKNTLDFQVAADHFQLKMQKEDRREKVGLGKVVDGSAYLQRVGR